MTPLVLTTETPRAHLIAQAQAGSISKKACLAWASVAYDYDPANRPADAIDGWEHLTSAKLPSGFEGHVIYHEASESTVFVNVGSNELRDFLEGGEASFGGYRGPLEDGLNFFVSAYGEYAPYDTKNIVCIGHSWGGAIAEAQVALGVAALDKAGWAAPVSIFGVGVASAGFEGAIRAMGRDKGLAVDDDADWNMRHYIRLGDPIRGHFDHEVIGQELAPPTIFSPVRRAARSGPVPDWAIDHVVMTNHNSLLYFQMFELDPKTHIYRNRAGKFFQMEKSWPEKTWFGTEHPDVALNCR